MNSDKQPTALVTGCGRRLGFFLCQQLRRQGYRVHGHFRSERSDIAQLQDAGVTLHQVDFASPDALQTLCEQLKVQLPTLDLLIHNASAFTPDTGQLSDDMRCFEQFFRIHMQAPMALTHSLTPALTAAGGNVIAITDIFAHEPNPAFATYCATKAGLDNLMRSLAKRLAPKVRVNTIEPGPILFLPEHDEAYRQRVLDKTPLAREGGLEPIWKAVQAIVSNDYMTGNRIKIDGGRSLADL